MVNLEIVAVGKSKDRWLDEAVAHYEKLLSKYARIKWTAVTSPAKSSSLSPAEIKRLEADKLEKILADCYLIALADIGKMVDSFAFAKNLERPAVRSRNEIK
ncbi:MAG: 23S rRNA (pseudouridine(1915)-N(3))-methyltransferase RlmH [candidate division Zixibacteria bacterium]|nr:23S rRNA (pseudouridine(1915)-N(3))-methyltransferase RlmH [candidate division Zixibacteria bacterium]